MNALPGQGGGLSAFKSGLVSGNSGGGMPTQASPSPFSPPSPRLAPSQLAIPMPQGPQGTMFAPGSTIHGQVAGQQNGQFLLRLGDLMMKADSLTPLRVGDSISLQVQGENKGQVLLKVVSSPFEKMAMSDLSQTLSSMKVSLDGDTMSLAKTMVEQKIPLTKEGLSELKTALAQTAPGAGQSTPASLPNRVAATNFLQQGQLPVTPQGVGALSNFLATNPQIGQQMAALNTEFKKLNEIGGRLSKELNGMIAGVRSEMNQLSIGDTPKSGGKKEPGGNASSLKAMAQQAGMEKTGTHYGPGGFSGGEDWDFPAMMRKMRERAAAEGIGGEKLLTLMDDLEKNIHAQRLINSARPESNVGYYYMQIPIEVPGFVQAEVWVQYVEEGEERRVVDLEDTRIEFFVQTERMGELHFVVDVRDGKVSIELGAPSQEVRQFIARYLPALAERVRMLGWETGRFRSIFRPCSGKRELAEIGNFEDLERCNIHA